jgi:hypothetical protein
LLFCGFYILGCLRWQIGGSLPSVISFIGHKHLLGGGLLLFKFFLS